MKLRKNIYLIIFITFFLISLCAETEKVGITQLYSDYKKFEPNFFIQLEDTIMSVLTDLPSKELYALNINDKISEIKEALELWKDNSTDLTKTAVTTEYFDIINELKHLNYCIALEVPFYHLIKERDFYDIDKFHYVFKINLKILTIDCMNKTYTDEETIAIEFKSEKEKDAVLNRGIETVIKKVNSYLEYQSAFRQKIFPTRVGKLFVWLNAGRLDGIKPQDVLVSYKKDRYTIQEQSAIRVIKAYDRKSIASILYKKGDISEDEFFNKTPKINFEIQLGGGFSLSYEEVSTENAASDVQLPLLPFGTIRTLIPVGIAFFRPGFQIEFNFFYLDNKFLLPFTFETGCQGEFNIHRFETDLGLMIGALFSPDKNRSYKLDSIVVRPYLHLSVLIITSIKLFGEAGYRFFIKGTFYKDWEVDLSGFYFFFGIGINL